MEEEEKKTIKTLSEIPLRSRVASSLLKFRYIDDSTPFTYLPDFAARFELCGCRKSKLVSQKSSRWLPRARRKS